MKKLSKAQQAVVDKMREGCIITTGGSMHWLRKSVGSRAISTCWHSTIISLLKHGIIERDKQYRSEVYRLTEQYKTAPEQKKETDAYGDLGRELDNPFNSDRWETFSNL